MEKIILNMTQKSLSEMLGVNEQEVLNLLRDRAPSDEDEHEEFISLLNKLIKD